VGTKSLAASRHMMLLRRAGIDWPETVRPGGSPLA
jgi:hypothetical protein